MPDGSCSSSLCKGTGGQDLREWHGAMSGRVLGKGSSPEGWT